MVTIALDGVEGCWLDADDKAALRRRIVTAAEEEGRGLVERG